MEVVSILGEKAGKMKFEETELRLGLPGNIIINGNGKRGLAETHHHHVAMDLKLNLVSNSKHVADQAVDSEMKKKNLPKEKNLLGAAGGTDSNDPVVKPPAK